MIAEFQFDSPLFQETIEEVPADEIVIEQLDASEETPLRAVCWLEDGHAASFEEGVETDRTVAEAVQVVDTPRGYQYNVTYREEVPGTDLYEVAVEEHGIFVAGQRRTEHWTVQFRFPDRGAFGAFRERCEEVAVDPTIQAIHERSAAPHADQYDISDPQREILLLAAEEGYFEVPRRVSLADLADELDVSSQAASERLRRGLDSLVERTLLTPE